MTHVFALFACRNCDLKQANHLVCRLGEMVLLNLCHQESAPRFPSLKNCFSDQSQCFACIKPCYPLFRFKTVVIFPILSTLICTHNYMRCFLLTKAPGGNIVTIVYSMLKIQRQHKIEGCIKIEIYGAFSIKINNISNIILFVSFILKCN